jgi:CHASE2 domain-containing sensor protein
VNLGSFYATYKKAAVGLIAICGVVNTILVLSLSGRHIEPYMIAQALALIVFSILLPGLLFFRNIGSSGSLPVFILAMMTNATVFGVSYLSFPMNFFAILAAVTAGLGASILTLLRAEQSSAEDKNRF